MEYLAVFLVWWPLTASDLGTLEGTFDAWPRETERVELPHRTLADCRAFIDEQPAIVQRDGARWLMGACTRSGEA